MLKRLVVQFLGLVISVFPMTLLLVRLLTKGWKRTFGVQERPTPPAILNDPRWGTHNYIQLQGVKVHYVEKGDRSKPLMIFVHGFPEFWFSWRFQLEHFSKNYWQEHVYFHSKSSFKSEKMLAKRIYKPHF